MAVWDRLEHFLFETPKRILIAALPALTFAKTGVWAVETFDHAAIVAGNAFVDGIADPRGQSLMSPP